MCRKRAVASWREIPDPYRANADAVEPDQPQADLSASPPYYAITSLVDGEMESRITSISAQVGQLWGEHGAIFEDGASGEGFEGLT